MGFGYKPFVLGRSTQDNIDITVETPPFEVDEVTTADTVYLRFEDADVAQLIVRVQCVGGLTSYSKAIHLWSDKENGNYQACITRK